MAPNPINQADVARIQASEAKGNGGKVDAGGFAARAAAAAAHNANAGVGGKSGGGAGSAQSSGGKK
jgi:hypothetical protein